MKGKRCNLCGGRLQENRCELCGLDNSIYERERHMERGQDLHMEKKPRSLESAAEKKIQRRQTEKQNVHNKKSTYKPAAPRKKAGCLTWLIILMIVFFSILPILEQVGEKLWDEFAAPRYYIGEERMIWKG